MRETRRVSGLMLERYHLGEVSQEERQSVEAALKTDTELRLRWQALDDSDRELRLRYPWRDAEVLLRGAGRFNSRRITGRRLWGLCAAALLLCVFFPSLYYLRGRPSGASELAGVSQGGPDRIKGTELKHELSVYLKESPAGEGRKLADSTLLKEGNTVQLAYTTPPGDPWYGVIFSIDGRSAVTLHYPYRRQQNPVLTTGKQTFLSEAYTLDDAPDFEVFFMVVSQKPLDTEKVLMGAGEIARDLAHDTARDTALAKSTAAFDGCEVEIVSIRK